MRRYSITLFALLFLVACTEQPPANTAAETTSSSTESDPRTLLTWDMLTQVNHLDTPSQEEVDALCAIETYTAAPTATAPYKSEKYGVEMMLPFNPKWGTREYRVPPYYEIPNEPAVYFGLLGHGEGCGLLRPWELRFLPPRSAEEAAASIGKMLIEGSAMKEPPSELAPQITTIGDHTVVEYVDVGLCSYPSIEVMGPKYNYKIAYCSGGEGRGKELEPLRAIVGTMEFMD